MLKQSTTFVLGAGASCDFNFPTGKQLQDKISEVLKLTASNLEFVNDKIDDAVRTQLNEQNWREERPAFLKAAKRICEGMPVADSIDNFLHTHQNDRHIVWLGKAAIAAVILDAEAKSPLAQKHGLGGPSAILQTTQYQKSWYFQFIRMLTRGTGSENPTAHFK